MERNVHERRKNSKTNEPHKIVLRLDWLDSKNSDKYVALENLSICYTWKNIKQQHKNNKLKIKDPTWIDQFELPDGSYSVSHCNYMKQS